MEPYVRATYGTTEHDSRRAIALVPMAERKYDFFINHCQSSGQDQCANLAKLLRARGWTVWYDMSAEDLTEHGMEVGVSQSRNVLMFLSEGLMSRPFCLKELRWARDDGVAVVPCVDREDKRNIGAFLGGCPEDLRSLGNIDFVALDRSDNELFEVRLRE